MKAKLILENGMVFEGKAFGYLKESVGEVVFTTGMTGYQEVLTDPSYYGQIVTMTYPLIGNYGINLEDMESDSVKVRGFIVREKCSMPSNFRCELELDDFLKQGKVIGLEGIDTRALTKVLRNSGTMRGIIALEDLEDEYIKEKIVGFSTKEAVKTVTTSKSYTVDGNGKHVAIMDFGIKTNIIRNFKKRGCKLTVFPATATAEEVLNVNPDLVFLSNGPGDPEDLDFAIENIKKLVGKKPITGICLGHQLLGLALGGKTAKLKFGHRGCNHPVKDLEANLVHITSQNHGYVVEKLPDDMEITHVNINDGTVEGMKHKTLPIYSVQFHPEASAGPKDSEYIFDRFLEYAL
ncbi:carbamoyl-phosphate synthase small subunit [Clostridium saccharoperbutylacetonicum]|uniref:Carbamoyl phosphate synthase small chain n=1 Tax=Clostridium saccharoperbutylacetonicum N1-4(HMT) TaxID=931276 RepID=M1MFW9_9CLOT|nr:glutamine-hydrolyzing carbamoyl-phosphate synthase small subunit [Clostridium saccharoperbutylacetonicum]AGF53876.1 carbamoyl-phosphate synthase small chain [Clostridium saccharoperbutylacetonicum N1-4(HMT)]NRT59611.1 carbamoyl-phosphate synthase small subunit [Clostridium saccharoperbutylacetonicum]NSB28803.1 carbamoyl-phosphate synthase small subunit [Clostridium saccharoperbutylacetonicum]NSB42294.1 carbamoyl-phosphate synthase small subunit [Clostridium saccharoperbutylacetonicum]